MSCRTRHRLGPSMWVTVNETFRAEFRPGFALTHRPSLHKARSLLVKPPILLPVARPGSKSSGPSLLKSPFTSLGCLRRPCKHLLGRPIHARYTSVTVTLQTNSSGLSQANNQQGEDVRELCQWHGNKCLCAPPSLKTYRAVRQSHCS